MQVCCGDFRVPLVNLIFFLQFDKVFFELPNDQPRASIWKIDHMEHSFRSLSVPSGESKRGVLLSYYRTNRNWNSCGASLEYLNLGRFEDYLFEAFPSCMKTDLTDNGKRS